MKKYLILAAALTMCLSAFGKKDKTEPQTLSNYYTFTDVKVVEATPVEDQSRSGTCWSFAANGFLESELLRMGKGEHNLSEMWIVRYTYLDKAIKYVRMHGEINFAAGGAFHDVFNVVKKYGIVPEEVYTGLEYGFRKHNHGELDAVLEGYVKAVVANNGLSLSTSWIEGLEGILDAYFGPVPETFTYQGTTYSPKTFAQYLGWNVDDFISLTSYTHHPFYSEFILEIPDNWAWGASYNLPLDEFMQVIDNAIETGYSVCWGADVSEKGFDYRKGFAVVPSQEQETLDGTEEARWVRMSGSDKDNELLKLLNEAGEMQITQQVRQVAFDNYQTTDDHGMLITGIAQDQRGARFYKVKNSWGTQQVYNGYFYASRPYVEYKTMNYVVHKDAIPADIKAKMGIN